MEHLQNGLDLGPNCYPNNPDDRVEMRRKGKAPN